MLAAFACMIGVFGLLVIAELLGKYHVLKGEFHRKFLHISVGCFIAFWPWLISWDAIKIIGLLMLAVTLVNRYAKLFNYKNKIGRASEGDILLAASVALLPFLTASKAFFAIAMLEVALADGLAAIVGGAYGKNWVYGVFGHKKTIIGSMTFWIASLCIFGIGLLGATEVISFSNYVWLICLGPPVLTLAENLCLYGLDNLILPLVTIAILKLAQS